MLISYSIALRVPITAALAAIVFMAPVLMPEAASAKAGQVKKVRQIGAFVKWENALKLSEEVTKAGKSAFILEKQNKGRTFYIVLESTRKPGLSGQDGKPASIKDLGYKQVASFLERKNAENMLKVLMAEGAVTFHCMKKINKKVYYKVYKKTGVVQKSPCTTIPVTHEEATEDATEVRDESAQDEEVMSLAPVADKAISNAPEAGEKPQDMEGMEAEQESPIENTVAAPETDEDSTVKAVATPPMVVVAEDMGSTVDTPDAQEERIEAAEAEGDAEEDPSTDEAGEEAMDEMGADENTEDMAEDEAAEEEGIDAMDEDISEEDAAAQEDQVLASSVPSEGLTEHPPLREAPDGVVLDMSRIRSIDVDQNFYIKPNAVVFKDRNQFGIWHGKYFEFGGSVVIAQSNKWFVLKLRSGKEVFVMKADTVEYDLPEIEVYR